MGCWEDKVFKGELLLARSLARWRYCSCSPLNCQPPTLRKTTTLRKSPLSTDGLSPLTLGGKGVGDKGRKFPKSWFNKGPFGVARPEYSKGVRPHEHALRGLRA